MRMSTRTTDTTASVFSTLADGWGYEARAGRSPGVGSGADGGRGMIKPMNRTEALSLAIWYAFIAAGIAFLYLISLTLVDGAVLTITGSATGQGLCNMTVQADLIAANVSLATNCSSWQIVAGGLA